MVSSCMSKNKKAILITIGFIILTGAVIGYMIWNKPQPDIKDASGIRISAVDLYKLLSTVNQSHKASLIGKVLIVSGEVTQVQINQKGQQLILLQTKTSGASVNCTMEEKIEKRVNTGDSILIKGICSGYISGDVEMGLPGDVYMIRCYLLPKKL